MFCLPPRNPLSTPSLTTGVKTRRSISGRPPPAPLRARSGAGTSHTLRPRPSERTCSPGRRGRTLLHTSRTPKPDGTEIIARWDSRWLGGRVAITRRALGAGSVIYAGTYLTHELVAQLFEPLFVAHRVEPALKVPAGLEVTTRSAPDRTLTFVQNTGDETMMIETPAGAVQLPAYGTIILPGSAPDRVPAANGQQT